MQRCARRESPPVITTRPDSSISGRCLRGTYTSGPSSRQRSPKVMSSRAKATQSRRPESKTDVRTAGRGATPPLPGGTGLQSLYSCRITSAPGQRPVQQPQQRLRTIRSILAASQSLKSCQATIGKWCFFSIPRKPMEPKVARPLRCVHRLRWAERPNRTIDRLPRPLSGAIEGRERRCKRYRGVLGSSELESRWAFCSAWRLRRGLSPPRSALS